MSEESVRRVECESYPGPPPFCSLLPIQNGDSLPAGTRSSASDSLSSQEKEGQPHRLV
uniref:Uncharacterized protein n=1 Tax=Anguilla anguilla TaxID=7936 RepID=A0A0E9QXG0_ANGAN